MYRAVLSVLLVVAMVFFSVAAPAQADDEASQLKTATAAPQTEQVPAPVDKKVAPQADKKVAPQVDKKVAPKADKKVAPKADKKVAPKAAVTPEATPAPKTSPDDKAPTRASGTKPRVKVARRSGRAAPPPNFIETSHSGEVCGQVTVTLRNVSPWIYPVSVSKNGTTPNASGPLYGPVVDNRTDGKLNGPQKDVTKSTTYTFAEDSGPQVLKYVVAAGSENKLYKGLPVGEVTTVNVDTDCIPPRPEPIITSESTETLQCTDDQVEISTVTTTINYTLVDNKWVQDEPVVSDPVITTRDATDAECPPPPNFIETSHSGEVCGQVTVTLRNVSPWIYPVSVSKNGATPNASGPLYGPVVDNRTDGKLNGPQKDVTRSTTYTFAEDSGPQVLKYVVAAGSENKLYKGLPVGEVTTVNVDTDCIPPRPEPIITSESTETLQCTDDQVEISTVTTTINYTLVDNKWVQDEPVVSDPVITTRDATDAECPPPPNFIETSHSGEVCGQVTVTLRNVSPWIYPVSVSKNGATPNASGPLYGPVVDNRTDGKLNGPQKDVTKSTTYTFAEDSGPQVLKYVVAAGSENKLYKGLPVGEVTTVNVDTDCIPPRPEPIITSESTETLQCTDDQVEISTVTTTINYTLVDNKWVQDEPVVSDPVITTRDATDAECPPPPNFIETSHSGEVCGQVTVTLRNVSPWIYPVSVSKNGATPNASGPLYGPVVDNRTDGKLNGPQKDVTKSTTYTFAEDSGPQVLKYVVAAGSENKLYKGLPVGEVTTVNVDTDCIPPRPEPIITSESTETLQCTDDQVEISTVTTTINYTLVDNKWVQDEPVVSDPVITTRDATEAECPPRPDPIITTESTETLQCTDDQVEISTVTTTINYTLVDNKWVQDEPVVSDPVITTRNATEAECPTAVEPVDPPVDEPTTDDPATDNPKADEPKTEVNSHQVDPALADTGAPPTGLAVLGGLVLIVAGAMLVRRRA